MAEDFQCTTLSERLIRKDVIKEDVVADFDVLFRSLFGETRKLVNLE